MLGRGPAHGPAGAGRSAADVTHEFLRLFVDTADRDGPPAGQALVAAVRPDCPAELTAVFSALSRPAPRLLPTPVAILLYLRHTRPDLAPGRHFIVCDLGASAVTLSLCALAGPRLLVADFARITGWPSAQAAAPDDAGGRRPLLVEVLAMALTGAGGTGAGGTGATPVRRWRELEDALADDEQRERLDAVLEAALADPTRYRRTVALRVGDTAVTAADVLRACAPLAERCAAELSQLIRRQEDPAWWRAGAISVVLTGGLSTLRPVREALLSAAGLDPAAPGPDAVTLNDTESLHAPALGAALVAAGLAEPGDRYPHALRLPVHRQVRDRIVTSYLELAPAGSIEVGLVRPVFVRERGGKTRVRIPPAAPEADWPVPVEVVLAGGAVAQAAFSPAQPPPPGLYHIGVRGHPNGAAIVLQPAEGGDPLSYPLVQQPGTAPQTSGSR